MQKCAARRLDQFYTLPDVSCACVDRLNDVVQRLGGEWQFIEPSAGAGAFLDHLPIPSLGLDIAPGRADIREADFLDWFPPPGNRRIAVVGNPPFGKNASLARRFFDHAATFADIIAFIVPRTFEKPNFVNRLDRSMHLVESLALDDWSFEFDGAPYAVPTVFQVWEKRAWLRPLTRVPLVHPHFAFVSRALGDFAFQRVGARAGLVSIDGLRKSPQSHYYLKANICMDELLGRLQSIDWSSIKHRTAGNPSIGKGELIEAYASRYS